jgi:CheY-like chemotaxis protein
VGKVKRGGIAAVLMDCQMPVMDGYTATEQIRAWETTNAKPRIPIIALTAHALAGERERVLRAGMDDYLSKPCRSSTLEKMLHVYMKGGEAEPPRSQGGATQAEPELAPDVRRSEKLSRLFIEKTPSQLEALGRAIERGPTAEVRALAHKLKGSCLAIEAPLMAKAAERLQKVAESGELEAAPGLFAELKAHHARVGELLRQELMRLSKPTPANDRARPSVRIR